MFIRRSSSTQTGADFLIVFVKVKAAADVREEYSNASLGSCSCTDSKEVASPRMARTEGVLIVHNPEERAQDESRRMQLDAQRWLCRKRCANWCGR